VPAATPAPSGKPRVKLITNYGPIVLELEPEAAPLSCANFLAYVAKGHYTGTIFHRVIEGFMIQGGGMGEDMKEKPTGPGVKNEAGRAFKAGLRNTRGTVALARTSDPDGAAAQFYINVEDNPSLDWKGDRPDEIGYTVFGRVVEGLENADKIAKVKTSWNKGMPSVPDYPVRLRSVELLPKP
jgi:cyclophilin family peptidyl-prolyl cis-trans isomerase